ncbi:hypothetical protein BOM23_23475, partial [Erwinia sp. OLMDLW33]
LLKQFAPGERMSLIVWTSANVSDVLDGEGITPEEADEINANISELDSVHEYGAGEETLRAMLENVRESARADREVRVTAGTLERIARLAGEYVRREEAEGGEGAARRHFPLELDALEPSESW